MTSRLVDGPLVWSGTRDQEQHREYKIKHRVECDRLDGPATAMLTPGLPLPGSVWAVGNDLDSFAYCYPDMEIEPLSGDYSPNEFFEISQKFSTKPLKKCQDEKIEDPLSEPQKVSGSFTKYTQEATHDRFGFKIVNSAWEQMRGAQVEFDANRPTVKIEQNVATLGLSLFSSMIDTVNDRILWGLPPRFIKLSNVSWEKKYHGLCYAYYTRTLEFEIWYQIVYDRRSKAFVVRNGWDRVLLDEGNKVLSGEWSRSGGGWALKDIDGAPPDRFNPRHFIRFTDRNGNESRVILDGFGQPAGPEEEFAVSGTGSGSDENGLPPGEIYVEKYGESNFLLLGIPLTF